MLDGETNKHTSQAVIVFLPKVVLNLVNIKSVTRQPCYCTSLTLLYISTTLDSKPGNRNMSQISLLVSKQIFWNIYFTALTCQPLLYRVLEVNNILFPVYIDSFHQQWVSSESRQWVIVNNNGDGNDCLRAPDGWLLLQPEGQYCIYRLQHGH